MQSRSAYLTIFVLSAISGCYGETQFYWPDGESEASGNGGGSTSSSSLTGSPDPATSSNSSSTTDAMSTSGGTTSGSQTETHGSNDSASSTIEATTTSGGTDLGTTSDTDSTTTDTGEMNGELKSCGDDCRWIFVSSEEKTGALGGVAGADMLCDELAKDAGLAGSYMAWLSSLTNDEPAERFPDGIKSFAGDFIRRDEAVVAAGWNAFTMEDLMNPISVDEWGVHHSASVWTNTTHKGTRKSEWVHCSFWTLDSFLIRGRHGDASMTTPAWADSDSDDCGSMKRIYCIQVSE